MSFQGNLCYLFVYFWVKWCGIRKHGCQLVEQRVQLSSDEGGGHFHKVDIMNLSEVPYKVGAVLLICVFNKHLMLDKNGTGFPESA